MKILELFKSKKIKITKARIEIYNIISSSENGISADFIYTKCIEAEININLSTVYRCLDLFEEKDIIEKFDLGQGKYSYAIKKHDHKHVLECDICHKEVELQCPMQQIEEMVKNRTGFTLTEHQLFMKGVCNECKGKKK